MIHLVPLLDVSHHGGLCLQERLGSGVSLELGHVFCAVPGYGGTVQTVVAADVSLQTQTPPFSLEFTLDLQNQVNTTSVSIDFSISVGTQKGVELT